MKRFTKNSLVVSLLALRVRIFIGLLFAAMFFSVAAFGQTQKAANDTEQQKEAVKPENTDKQKINMIFQSHISCILKNTYSILSKTNYILKNTSYLFSNTTYLLQNLNYVLSNTSHILKNPAYILSLTNPILKNIKNQQH